MSIESGESIYWHTHLVPRLRLRVILTIFLSDSVNLCLVLLDFLNGLLLATAFDVVKFARAYHSLLIIIITKGVI